MDGNGSEKRSRDDKTLPAAAVLLPPMKKKRKGRDCLDDELAEYYFRNGLRCVYPYKFTFLSYAKGRWVGRKIYELFCKEFVAETPEYYAKALEAGKITVNGIAATKETMVKDNDLIGHRVHRHEPPVVGVKISIVHEDLDHLVINKPPSIPVHPCGKYRHNTAWFILVGECHYTGLHSVHRIDRLTSGILIFAKSVGAAQKLEKQIREREVEKTYVCKVEGEFPQGRVECNEPIKVECHRLGVCRVDPTGKQCATVFERSSYDGTNSIVNCYPKTGRMHQIRVHLQWLGYPITNDPVYNHRAWGCSKGKSGVQSADMENIIAKIGESLYSSDQSLKEVDTPTNDTDTCSTDVQHNPSQPIPLDSDTGQHDNDSSASKDVETASTEILHGERACAIITGQSVPTAGQATADGQLLPSFDSNKLINDPDCTDCKVTRPDPTPSQLVMYLHALSYQGPGWKYHTDLPSWALEKT